MKNRKTRILWIDFIKGLCIFMVVFYHAIFFQGKNNYINSDFELLLKSLFDILMMPCFFAVSGYLYKPIRNIKKYLILLYKKIISFGIPYIIFYLLFAINYSKGQFKLLPIINLKDIFLHPDGDLWFLKVLLFIFIIVGLLDLIGINLNIQLIVFFILLLLFLIIVAPYFPHQHLLQAFNIIFFLLGRKIKGYSKVIKCHYMFIFSLFIISFIIMLFIPVTYDYQFISLNTLIPKILGVLTIFSMSMNIHHIKNLNKMYSYFIKYGQYSLVIYIGHFIPVLIMSYLLKRLTNYYLLNSIIVTSIVWIFSIMICYLVKKITILNFIFYPRKYINKLLLNTKSGNKV